MSRPSRTVLQLLESAPPLPIAASHWRAIVKAMRLSKQQARVAELVLRDFSTKQIVLITGLSEGTVKDYLNRIARRTGTHGRMQFAMHVLALSHRCRDS